MTYEISLAALLAMGTAEYNLDGDLHRVVAKDMIEAERKKLAVLIETDQPPDSQAAIWTKVQEILVTRIFNADKGPDGDEAFASRLPDEVNGDYDADTALTTIDEIIWALSSVSNLESSLDKDESRLFVQENDAPFVGRAVADIFNERELQVRARSGMTDFTRFGVWRVRRNRQAQTAGWRHGELDTFAYSPVAQAKISSLSAPNYPHKGEATYEGSTVAFVGRISQDWGLLGFEGDVAVNVNWTPPEDTQPGDGTLLQLGTMTVAISNFAQTETGDPLRHSDRPVRELVFSAGTEGIAITTNDKHEVMFAPSDVTLSVVYEDRRGTGSVTSATLNGAFVGSSSDGPLGVLGRYSVPESPEMSFEQGGGAVVRNNVSIHGAFGADLP